VAFHCPPGNNVMAIIRLRADASKKNSKNIGSSLSTSTIYDFPCPFLRSDRSTGAEWGRASSRHGGGKILPWANLFFFAFCNLRSVRRQIGTKQIPQPQRSRRYQAGATPQVTANQQDVFDNCGTWVRLLSSWVIPLLT
jgi:hypothetical protein